MFGNRNISHISGGGAGDEAGIDLILAAAEAAGQSDYAQNGVATSFFGGGSAPDGYVQVEPNTYRVNDAETALVQAAQLMRLDLVRASPLFNDITGAGQAVVVIDTGADLDHSHFGPATNGVSNRILFQQNFWQTNGGPATDLDGHGTHVAGIVGSQDATHRGVAPGSNLIILKVLNPSGSAQDIEEAWQWVVANRNTYNIAAVSMSIQNTTNFNTNQTTDISDEVNTLFNSGIASIVCAGNHFGSSFNTPGVTYWAAAANIWGIASTLDNANTFSSFSQRSTTMTELAAPGSNITAAHLNNGTATLSGTSMATPMVSGLVALAQDLSNRIAGQDIGLNTLLNIMRTTGVNITDGTSTVPRVDALNIMNGVMNFWQQSTGGNDIVFGWRGNDTLNLQGGNDQVRGRGGNDIIDGGAGTDYAYFSGLRSQYTITKTGQNAGTVVGPDGNDTLSNIEFLVFDNGVFSWPSGLAKSTDLNGDGTSDVLFRHGNGFVASWQVLGGNINVEYAVRAMDNGFTSLDNTGDFNGDGTSDLLWRHSSGGVASWQMQGGHVQVERWLGSMDASWTLFDTGDFNADGKHDVLWRHSSGFLAAWQMNGGVRQLEYGIGAMDPARQLIGTNDINGDGDSDILFRQPGGYVGVWDMQGGLPAAERGLGFLDMSWNVVGLADFTGDGVSDLLWRHTSGTVVLWQMNAGGGLASERFVGAMDASWTVAESGDYNGDGTHDVLWRHSAGSIAEWLLNNGNVAVARGLGSSFDNGWQVM